MTCLYSEAYTVANSFEASFDQRHTAWDVTCTSLSRALISISSDQELSNEDLARARDRAAERLSTIFFSLQLPQRQPSSKKGAATLLVVHLPRLLVWQHRCDLSLHDTPKASSAAQQNSMSCKRSVQEHSRLLTCVTSVGRCSTASERP